MRDRKVQYKGSQKDLNLNDLLEEFVYDRIDWCWLNLCSQPHLVKKILL